MLMPDKQFDPYPWSLKEVVENNFYEVPIYQRPYTWSTNEVDSLLDDLFDAYRAKDKQNEGNLFVGQLFLRKQGKGKDGVKDKYEVVDGQQRLTTFAMILISIYSICKKRKFLDTDKDILDLKSYLWKYSKSARSYNTDERLITLSSIDKDFFNFIFDSALANPAGILKLVDGYSIKCHTESNLRNMLHKVYKRIEDEIPNNDVDNNEILMFLAFILEKTLFIAIQSSIDMPHVFAVFESINSKGKPLDDIDKIKTYIFSVLDEKDYSDYLTKWGQLIIKSDDHLGDYLQTYVKAFLFFYRQKINLIEFKYISRKLPEIYNLQNVAESLKKLIDDMLAVADYYSLLSDERKLNQLIKKDEFKAFYKLFLVNGYSHPKPLIFRSFCEYFAKDENGNSIGKISKDDLTKIVKSSTLFMFKFQSIKGGDSKDAIKYFENCMKEFYGKEKVDSKRVQDIFKDALLFEGINKSVIKDSLVSMDFYSRHDLAYCILSLLESINTSKNNKLIYSQAYMMLTHIKDQTFHIDHMLPQSPDKNNEQFKYYPNKTAEKEVLVLKDGHDFPEETVFNGMDYSEFKTRTIHRIGNTRLFIPELNESKSNEVLHIPDHEDFTTYKQVLDRCDSLAELLTSSPDLK